jgi:hypothetical protein
VRLGVLLLTCETRPRSCDVGLAVNARSLPASVRTGRMRGLENRFKLFFGLAMKLAMDRASWR